MFFKIKFFIAYLLEISFVSKNQKQKIQRFDGSD